MINVFGFPIIYALQLNPSSIPAIIDPAPGTLYFPIIVYLSGLVPNNLIPCCKWKPIRHCFMKVILESQPITTACMDKSN